MARPPKQAAAATKWLTPAQLEAWQALTLMLARLPTALEAQLQRDSQLSYIEYYALAALSEQPDRTMRMSELAVLTNAELSRLSHLITRLQKRGYVRREPDPGTRGTRGEIRRPAHRGRGDGIVRRGG